MSTQLRDMFNHDTCHHSWREEAESVIRDVQEHVHRITISNLPSTNQRIYFNMTTLEMKDFCVELTRAGFRIVGEKYDSNDLDSKYQVYETPYSMLDNASPSYRESFKEELLTKLNLLKDEQLQGRQYDEENDVQEEDSRRC